MEGHTTDLTTSYDQLWACFQPIFSLLDLKYVVVFEGWIEHVFSSLIQQNIMHLEARLPPTFQLYDTNFSNKYPPNFTVQIIEKVLKKVQQTSPNFSFKLISTPLRMNPEEQIKQELQVINLNNLNNLYNFSDLKYVS